MYYKRALEDRIRAASRKADQMDRNGPGEKDLKVSSQPDENEPQVKHNKLKYIVCLFAIINILGASWLHITQVPEPPVDLLSVEVEQASSSDLSARAKENGALRAQVAAAKQAMGDLDRYRTKSRILSIILVANVLCLLLVLTQIEPPAASSAPTPP